MAQKAKKPSATQFNELGKNPRDLTVKERRDLFLKKKKELSKDWRVIQANQVEELVPSNLLAFDYGLRLYGTARRGTVYHIHGDEESGKSTLTYALCREYQKATDEPVAIFDFEGTAKSSYFRAMGLNESMAYVKQPSSIEDALKDAIDLLGQGVRHFTFDSIPRMRSMVDIGKIKNGEAFSTQPGTHAKAIEQFYVLFLPHVQASDGTLLMVNQVRARIEMTQQAQWAASGKGTVTNLNYILPGGRANRYNASAMVELSKQKAWRPGKMEDEFILEPEAENGEPYIAMEIKGRTLKNKVTGTGYRESTFWIRPGQGLDELVSIRQYARQFKLIDFHGKRWFVGEDIDKAIKVYDNKAKAIEDLVIHPNLEILKQLKGMVIQKFESDPSIGALEVEEDVRRYVAGEIQDEYDDNNAIPKDLKPTPPVDDELK